MFTLDISYMGQINISTTDDEAKEWKKEADELNISQSRYGRERLRAGRRLWNSGDFQADTLAEFLDTHENQTDAGRGRDLPQATVQKDLADIVHRELPTDNAGDPVDLSELRELIFGSEEEQRTAILDALEVLEVENRAERKITGGFVKTENEPE
jgi:hypothetical protein